MVKERYAGISRKEAEMSKCCNALLRSGGSLVKIRVATEPSYSVHVIFSDLFRFTTNKEDKGMQA